MNGTDEYAQDEPPAVEESALPEAEPVADDPEWQPMEIPDEPE